MSQRLRLTCESEREVQIWDIVKLAGGKLAWLAELQ